MIPAPLQLERAVAVRQPFAWMIAQGLKRCETRSSSLGFIPGEWLAIQASQAWFRTEWGAGEPGARTLCEVACGRAPETFTRGAIVAVARVHGVSVVGPRGELLHRAGDYFWDRIDRSREERAGDFRQGRWITHLTDVTRLAEPVAVRGRLGRYRLDPDIARQVCAQLEDRRP